MINLNDNSNFKLSKDKLKEKLRKMPLSELKLYHKDLNKKIRKRLLVKDKDYPVYPLRFVRQAVETEIKMRRKKRGSKNKKD